MTVEDVYGVTDTATKTVQVNSVPEADFGYSPSIDFVGQEIQFSDESTDAYSSIESVMWNFGDSTTSTGSSPSHTYTEPETYEIELTVEDEHGATNTRTVEAEVESALNAEYSYEPVQPEIGEEIEFVDESSNEYAEIESVEWSFGDSATSTELNPSHSYEEPGEYNVSLTVTDEYGARDTFWIEVIVPEESMT